MPMLYGSPMTCNVRFSACARVACLIGFAAATGAAFAVADSSAAGQTAAAATMGASAAAGRPLRPAQRQQKQSTKANNFYITAWGIETPRVSYTASGNLIRFTYRVVHPERAMALANKAATPQLVSPRHNVALQVPVMEKVGPLRQSAAPQAGQTYWMVFSNKGNLVRPGDRVNVVIGQFHADGLMVE
jgi:hypothetical protein